MYFGNKLYFICIRRKPGTCYYLYKHFIGASAVKSLSDLTPTIDKYDNLFVMLIQRSPPEFNKWLSLGHTSNKYY